MPPTILLYDIDGTLISSSGAGRRAMERAFTSRCGHKDMLDFRFDGMTDGAIARQGLRRAGIAEGDDEALSVAAEALIATYLAELRDEAGRADHPFRVHVGVERALGLTRGRPGFAVGLGTGNVRTGATIKLERVGLHRHFSFGGFGCDHVDRAELLRIGAERGAAELGQPRAACRVVVIGDTPKDIAAAHAIGAVCLAVATGNFSTTDLAAHGAEHVVASLDSPGADAAILGAAA